MVLIGEIGGTAEEDAAAYIAQHVTKPVVGFIAGQTGRRDGAWAMLVPLLPVGGGTDCLQNSRLEPSGIKVVHSPARIGETVADVLKHVGQEESHGKDPCNH